MTIPELSEGNPITIDLLNKIIAAANDTPFDITAGYGGNFTASGDKIRIESASVVASAGAWGVGTIKFMRPFSKPPIVIGSWGDTTNVNSAFVVRNSTQTSFTFVGAKSNIPNVRVNYIAIGV